MCTPTNVHFLLRRVAVAVPGARSAYCCPAPGSPPVTVTVALPSLRVASSPKAAGLAVWCLFEVSVVFCVYRVYVCMASVSLKSTLYPQNTLKMNARLHLLFVRCAP